MQAHMLSTITNAETRKNLSPVRVALTAREGLERTQLPVRQ
jgi:hypothetical protein